MTTPTLELNIRASGVEDVKNVTAALAMMRTEVGRLGDVTKGLSAVDQLQAEVKGLRSELVQGLQEIQSALTKGMATAFAAAKTVTDKGGAEMVSSFDANMRKLTDSISKQNEEIQRRLTQLNAGNIKQATLEGTKVGEAYANSAQTAAAKVRYSTSVSLGDSRTAGISASSLSALDATRAKVQATTEALEADYAKAIVMLDKQVSAVMKAATEGPNTMRDSGYIAWWNRVVTDMEKGEAALAAEYAKAINTLDKQVAEVMRAATQGPNTMHGSGYIAWWDKVLADEEAGLLKLQQLNARFMAASERGQVSSSVSARAQLDQGIPRSTVTSSYGSLATEAALAAPSLDALKSKLEDVGRVAPTASAHIKQLGLDLNDAHSAARGLASGFGAMWLTWGNIAPLLAGAAISHSFMEVIKLGAEVQHTFETIRVLSEETIASVSSLSAEMLDLARTGPFGPLAISEAMKTLSLAGLNAQEVGSSIKDVLNFSVAGTTSIQEAADVLTTVGVAFKISANDYNYIGDVISKAAAVSKSSVEGMGAAFKTASTVNSLYGVSLRDVGANLALLANVGIQNSNAGTSLTNMYIDLAGRTPKATKALHELGIEVLDLNGKMRPLGDLYHDLLNKLSEKTPDTQLKYINDIFAQRSRKDVVAIMDAMRTAAKEAGPGIVSEFDRIMAEIDKAAGFQALAAASMMLTPLNQMKSVAASMQATLVEAFTGVEPYVLSISTKLKEMVNSDDFRNGLQRIVIAVAGLTEALVDNLGIITSLLAAYVGFKIFTMVGVTFTNLAESVAAYSLAANQATVKSMALTGALGEEALIAATAAKEVTKLTVQQELNNVAASAGATNGLKAAAGMSSVLAIGSKLLPWLTAAWLAWEAYSFWSGKSAENHAKSGSTFQATLDSLKSETDRLHELNAAKREGISLDEARAKASISAAEQDAQLPVAAAQRALLQAQERLGTGEAGVGGGASRNSKLALEKQLKDIASAQVALNNATALAASKVQELRTQSDKLKAEAQEQADRVKAEQKAREDALPRGIGTKPDDTKVKGFGVDLAELQKNFNLAEGVTRKAYEVDRQLLDDRHSKGLVSEGAYLAQMDQLAQTYQDKTKALAQKAEEDAAAAYLAKITQAQGRLKPAQFAQFFKDETSKYLTEYAGFQAAIDKVDEEARLRRDKGAIDAQGSIIKLNAADDEYWEKAGLKVKKANDLAQAERDMASLSDDVRARRQAEIKVLDENTDHMDMLQRKYLDAAKSLQDFQTVMGDPSKLEGKAAEDYKALTDILVNLAKRIESATDKVKELQNVAGDAAVADAQNKATQKMREDLSTTAKNISGKVADAILAGGKGGGQALKDWFKSYFVLEPIKLLIQALVQPVGSMIAGGIQMLSGGSAAAGGVSNLLSGASGATSLSGLGSTIGSAYMAGYSGLATTGAGVGLAAEGGGATLIGSTGLMAAEGGGVAAGVGSALAAIPVVGWVALAAMALYEMFGKNGEQRSGGQYGYNFGGNSVLDPRTGKSVPTTALGATFLEGPDGGDANSDATKTALNTTVSTINGALASLGSSAKLTAFQGGYETSGEGRGGVYAGGTFNTGASFGASGAGDNYAGTMYDSRFGFNMDPKQAGAALTTDLKQNIIMALKAVADTLPKDVSDILNKVDATKLTDATADALVGLINTEHATKFASVKTYLNGLDPNNVSADEVTLATNADALFTAFGKLGTAFDYATKLSVEDMGKLIDAGGGMAKLSANLSSYYDNFYTTAEKSRNIATTISATLAGAGLNYSPDQILGATRAQFRSLVDQFATMGAAGQDAYLALIGVNDAFASIVPAATEATAAAQHLQTLMDTVSKAHDTLVSSYQNEVSTLQSTITRLTDFAKSLRNFRDTLLLGTDSPLTPAQKYAEALKQFQTISAKAEGGDATAQGQLQGAAQNFLDASRAYYASNSQYTSDFNMVQQVLSKVADGADSQLTAAQQQLSLDQEQLVSLGQIETATVSVADAMTALTGAVLALAGQSGTTGSWVNVGTDGSKVYAGSNGAAAYQDGAGNVRVYTLDGQSYTPAQIKTWANTELANGQPMEIYNRVKAAGVSMSEFDMIMSWAPMTMEKWATTNGLPTFARGTNRVPHDMFALIHEGERIIPAADNRQLMRSVQGGDSGLREEVRLMRKEFVEEVRSLREDNNAGHALNADQTAQAKEKIADAVVTAVAHSRGEGKARERATPQ